MGTDTKTARDRAVYAYRFVRLVPELTKRAMRKENLAFHAIQTLDRTEEILKHTIETVPTRHAERFERWWSDISHSYWDG